MTAIEPTSNWTAPPLSLEPSGPMTTTEPVVVGESTEGATSGPNASVSGRREGPGYISAWVGRISLACFLAMREVELANRSSADYFQLVGAENASAIYVRLPGEGVYESIVASITRIPSEDLEDGMTYELGMKVMSAVNRYHELALTLFAKSIFGGEISPARASHTLRWLGRIRDDATESSRLRLLSRGLRVASPVIRDGAALGLAAMECQEAIPMLRQAARDEPIESLRRDLEQVLRELDQPG
jgi:hypothetical protein